MIKSKCSGYNENMPRIMDVYRCDAHEDINNSEPHSRLFPFFSHVNLHEHRDILLSDSPDGIHVPLIQMVCQFAL